MRPLTEKGAVEAESLAPLLAAYGIEQLVCSNTRRCTDTLRPYAETYGVRCDEEPLFSETGYQQHRDEALDRAVRLLTIDRPTVVCSHRPVLPDLAVLLCRRSGIDPPTGGLKVGAFWVLHLADGRVVDVEEHVPGALPHVPRTPTRLGPAETQLASATHATRALPPWASSRLVHLAKSVDSPRLFSVRSVNDVQFGRRR